MVKKFKCFIRIFKTDTKTIEDAFKKSTDSVYEGNIPKGTFIKISKWKNSPQVEILGSGEDNRCAFCNYFRQIIGEENAKRYNCPFINSETIKDKIKKLEEELLEEP